MEMGRKMVVMVVVMAAAIQVSACALCNMRDAGLAACKPSVTPPKPAEPSKDCCKALHGANFKCLCSLKDSPMLRAFGVDPNLAMHLPIKCKLSAGIKC